MQYVDFFAVRHDTGVALPGASVAVYQTGTSVLAPLYDATGIPLANPATADAAGRIGFQAPDGAYDIGITAGVYTSPLIQGFQIVDGLGLSAGIAALTALAVTAGAVVYPTLDALNADLAHPANTVGVVTSDPTPSNDGLYVKSGASGSGGWTITSLTWVSTPAAEAAASTASAAASTATAQAGTATTEAGLAAASAATAQAGASAALADAAAAHVDRLAADSDAAQAAQAVSQTAALAMLPALAATFSTRAAATAALSTLAANAVVMVFADESQSGHVTLYQKEGTALVLMADLSMPAAGLGVYESRSAAAAAFIPATVSTIELKGFLPGDGVRATYTRSTSQTLPAGSQFQSADGAWWSMARDARGVNARAFGALGGAETFTGAIAAGSAQLTTAEPIWSAAMVGQVVALRGAGPSGGWLITTVTAVASDSIVTLGSTASTTVTAAAGLAGPNDQPAIQAAIDYATYVLQCPVYIPAGRYLIADTLHLGYGVGGFSSTVVEGDGPGYEGGAGFTGTTIFAAFCDRPAMAVSGGRAVKRRGLSLIGLNMAYVQASGLGGFTPSSDGTSAGSFIDDTNAVNWIDPAILASAPNCNGRNTPYAGLAIDPYAGSQPSPAYPPVAYPAWAQAELNGGAAIPQYGKAFTSQVSDEDCEISGFVVRRAIQPNGNNGGDGNGDFVKEVRGSGVGNVYLTSAGNTQGRLVTGQDCVFTQFHTGLANGVHGTQEGALQSLYTGSQFAGCIQWIDIPAPSVGGPVGFVDCYGEQVWRIGRWGVQGDVVAACKPLTLLGCEIDFTGQTDWRGYPSLVLEASTPNPVVLDGCMLSGFGSVLTFGGQAQDFELRNLTTEIGTGDTAARPNAYQQLAHNFLGGGLQFSPVGLHPRPAAFSTTPNTRFDLSTGGGVNEKIGDDCRSERGLTACAWSRFLVPSYAPGFRVPMPNPWFELSKGATAGSGVMAGSLSGRELTLTLASNLTAGWQQAMYGPAPGDVLYDDQTGAVFFCHSNDGVHAIAALQSNYRMTGGTFDAEGTNTGGTATTLAAIPMTAGNWFIGAARLYSPEYFTQGSLSAGSATIAAVGRADGYGGYVGGASGEVQAGDLLYLDNRQDGAVANSNALVASVAAGSPASITLAGAASASETAKPLSLFARAAPANSGP